MKAVIMAGGKGTRLQSIAKDIPKPMFPILGKPIIEYQIDSLIKSNIKDITIMIGYLGEVIKDYFGNGEKWGVNIKYIQEETPLGSAGSLFYIKNLIEEDFILLFGDIILDIDFNRFYQFHIDKHADITLFAHPNSHPYDSDLLVVGDDGRVLDVIAKNLNREEYYNNIVNAGIYCISYKALDAIDKEKKLDLDKDIVQKAIKGGRVFAYISTEYAKDMGTPDRLDQVTHDIQNQLVYNKSLKNKQRVVFLDRDGTINYLKGYIKNTDEFELLPNVIEAMKLINNSEYLAIVITNQPVVARGECTIETLNQIHKKMETLLGNEGCYINGLYYCTHHPDSGFDGEVVDLKIDCDCRKPKIGLINRAVNDYNIDVHNSWFIGDSTIDIKTGKNAKLKTILVNTGECGKDNKYKVEADYIACDLLDAVRIVLNNNKNT